MKATAPRAIAATLMPKLLAAAPSKSAPLALGEDEEVVPLAEVPVLLEEEPEPVVAAETAEAVELASAGASLEWQMPVERVSAGAL
jgi:hypothetical protein